MIKWFMRVSLNGSKFCFFFVKLEKWTMFIYGNFKFVTMKNIAFYGGLVREQV